MDTVLLFLNFAFLAGILTGVAYLIYKIRRVSRLTLDAIQEDLPRFITGAIERYFRQGEALAAVLMDLRLQTSLPPTRNWAASPDLLRELMLHVFHYRPQVIVECGSGVSTLVLAHCLKTNGMGHLYSLEHLQDQADKTRQELARHGLEAHATLLNAPLRPHDIHGERFRWYAIEELPFSTCDMLVIDGPPAATGNLARYPAGPLLFDRLSPRAAVFVDDSNRDQEQTILARWRQEFPCFRLEVRHCEKGCVVLWKEK
jgi:predicted O-methyltransferase YrrM